MGWLFPASIATAAGVLFLCQTTVYLYHQYRDRFMRTWAIAWGCYFVRYLCMAFGEFNGRTLLTQAGYYLFTIAAGVFLLCGTEQFIGKRGHRWPIVLGAVIGLWCVTALVLALPPAWVYVPVFEALAVVGFYCGSQLLRENRRRKERAARMVGWLFIAWGIHQADYPLLRPIPWFAPWGYIIGALLAFAIAMGLIVMHFERVQRILQQMIMSTAALEKDELFREAVRLLATMFGVRYAMLGRLTDLNLQVTTVALWADDRFVENLTYKLEDTPCANTVRQDFCIYTQRVADLFPQDGMLRDMNVNGYVGIQLRDKEGKSIGLLVLMDDEPLHPSSNYRAIMEYFAARIAADLQRQDAEDQARANAERFRVAMEAVRDGVWDWWLDTNTVYFSPGYYTMLGYAPDEFPASYQAWTALIHPDDLARAEATLSRCIAGESDTYGDEFRLRARDGSWRWILGRGQVVARDDSGRAVHLIGTHIDLTAEKEAAGRELEFQRQLLQAQKLESLGLLAGGVAHDFNNFLTMILGQLDLAKFSLAAENPARARIDCASQAARQAALLTRQMLAYAGRGQVQLCAVDLNEVVRNNFALFSAAVPKNVALRLDSGANLPLIEADPVQLQQVVMNLITNAAEAVGDQPGTVTLCTSVQTCDAALLARSRLEKAPEPGRFVMLEVRDTGCGMNAATQERLFDPFFSTKFAGRGLGMSAVLGIVREHRGAIMVDSAPGAGATFRLYFPVLNATCQAEPAPVRSAPGGTGMPHMAGALLVIDDEEMVRFVVTEYARDLGIRVLTAANGEEGLEVCRAHADEITAVLLDLTMPKLDGLATFREIRRMAPRIRIVLSSGYLEQDATASFVGEKLDAFLQKPWGGDELRACLAMLFPEKSGVVSS